MDDFDLYDEFRMYSWYETRGIPCWVCEFNCYVMFPKQNRRKEDIADYKDLWMTTFRLVQVTEVFVLCIHGVLKMW